jgi:tRNA A-37 threonylcarbamoyl transferase component Bud32
MAVHVGTVLAGRYQITEPIATGGMGEVWQARDRTLGRIIAVKVLKSEYTGDSSFLIRFRNEARHTAALSHPNIASVYDYGETTEGGERLAYLIMEFVEGKPLVTILAERGRLTVEQTLDVLGQASDGLSAAHEAGMVHRDIKPGNLLVRPDGVVKLTDFGIAYARDAAPLTRTGMVVGTAQYLSPEQAQGHVVTAASDVYSLGVLGYECIAGVRPFDGESQVAIALAQINRPPPPLPGDVPPAVRQLIDRALSKSAAGRFPDGAAFARAVRQVAAGGTVPPPVGPVPGTGPDDMATTMIPVAEASTGVLGTTAPRTMPPLQGPPTGGAAEWDDDGAEDPARRRRTPLLWAAAAVALLGLLVAGFIVLQSGGDDGEGDVAAGPTGTAPSGSASAPASAPGSDTVTFDPASLLGKDVDDAKAELEELELRVTTVPASQQQLARAGVERGAGDVVAVDPDTGTVARDSEVTLSFAADDYDPDAAEESAPSSAPTDGGGAGAGQPTPSPTSCSPQSLFWNTAVDPAAASVVDPLAEPTDSAGATPAPSPSTDAAPSTTAAAPTSAVPPPSASPTAAPSSSAPAPAPGPTASAAPTTCR